MRKFSLRLLLGTIHRFRVTYLFLAPPVVVMLAKSDLLARHDLSSVKFLFCGAAPLKPELSKKLETIFSGGKARSRQGWGMTEATMAVTLFAPDEFDPSYRGVGYLVPNMEMKIIGHHGQPVGCNEEGEAVIRGPNIFKGYYENPSATRQAWTEDGWMKTGDVVIIDETGLLTVVNRKKVCLNMWMFFIVPALRLRASRLTHVNWVRIGAHQGQGFPGSALGTGRPPARARWCQGLCSDTGHSVSFHLIRLLPGARALYQAVGITQGYLSFLLSF